MSKEDNPIIIPRADYQEELEALVQMHTTRIEAGNPFRVTKKYKRIDTPEFGDDKRAKLDWELDFIDKCRNGYDGMSGRYFFYYHGCSIKHKSRGKIRPDFRATMMDLSNTIDRIIKTPGDGLVEVKRRQFGMSWYIAADNIYDCTFNKDFDIGMNSKGLIDSYNLFTKHKYVHRNLPSFLRIFVNTDRRDAMIFSKWVEKEKKWIGTGSSIISVAPTPTGHAGNQYKKWTADEYGETEAALEIYANTVDCITQDGIRVGTPMFFGSMGKTDKQGKGLKEFWTKHKQYGLTRYGVWGYNCLIMDDLGNDRIEDSVRWIIYERKKRESLASTVYNKFVQNFPLNEDDAFLLVSGTGVGNPVLRAKVHTELMTHPPLSVTGWMRPKGPGNPPDFVPDPNGKIIVYERPQLIRNGYVAALDPAEDDDAAKTRDNSNLSTAIMAKPFGLSGPRLVLEYTDRPKKLTEYYEQLALALLWYNHAQCLVEMNKGGFRVKDYFEANRDYAKLLSLAPKSPTQLRGGYKMEVGERMTTQRKLQMIGLLESYWEHYWQLIPSIRFVEECGVFGADHADDDLATAVGWCLMLLQADHRLVAHTTTEDAQSSSQVRYKNIGGRIELVSGNTPLKPTVRTTNPLFNK